MEPQPSPEMAALLEQHGIVEKHRSAPDVIVLAVKPQIMTAVLASVAPLAGRNTAVLSIAAGRTVASISKHFPNGAAIVRAMPNLPVRDWPGDHGRLRQLACVRSAARAVRKAASRDGTGGLGRG